MCSAWDNVALPTWGFPIRASPGQWLFSASPGLFAAVHALHRLLVPRHPPCALNILTVDRGESLSGFASEKSKISPKAIAARQLPDTRVIGYCAVFKVREEAQPARNSPRPGLSAS